MSHPKNKDYKSGGSPEKDEHKMPVRWNELVEFSGDFRDGDEIYSVKKVDKVGDIREGDEGAIRVIDRPNTIEIMKDQMDLLFKQNYQIQGQLNNLHYQNITLSDRLAFVEYENRILRSTNLIILYNHMILHTSQVKKNLETCFCIMTFGLPVPGFGEYYRLDSVLDQIADQGERSAIVSQSHVQEFMAINNNRRYVQIFRVRNDIAHPSGVDFQSIDLIFNRLRFENLSTHERSLFEAAQQLVSELRNLTNLDGLIEYYYTNIYNR